MNNKAESREAKDKEIKNKHVKDTANIQKLVEKEMEEKKLGSVIFMSTSQYISILLSLPCPNCLDIVASNQTFCTKISGFGLSYIITCLLCETSTQYSNKDSGIKYSQLVAGATLAGGINRNSFQTALATIGITNQCCKKSYYIYQTHMYKPIIDSAKFSSETILLEILD
jgi:hypothetical protein